MERRTQVEGDSEDREENGPKGGGAGSARKPEAHKQINLTDSDSCLMRKSRRSSYEQAYNAQAVVDADGSQLVLGTDVLQTPSDANQLEQAIATVPKTIGAVETVLADGGYVNAEVFERIEKRGDCGVRGDQRRGAEHPLL